MMKSKLVAMITMTLLCGGVFADVTVSDVQVFSGHPWKEVLVGYTIAGTSDETLIVGLTAEDRSSNKTYVAKTLVGANVTEGRHIMRWNAATEGATFLSTNVVFTISLASGGVQLWENGPYWAKCNVGATKPEEYGYYFWWGDTVGYKRNAKNNGWVSVKDGTSFSFDEGNCRTYERNTSRLQEDGYIDSTRNLVAVHDAATAHLGALWRMPTDAEFEALISNCDTTWTTRNGVYGRLVTGKGAYASKSIFLPAAGYGDCSGLSQLGSYGTYWSSTTPSGDYYCAWTLCLGQNFYIFSNDRRIGRSVRPVRGSFK